MRKLEHAEPTAFRNLIHGEASRAEAMLVVRHLLAGCSVCQKRAAAAQEEDGTPDTWSYDAAFGDAGYAGDTEEPAKLRLVRAG